MQSILFSLAWPLCCIHHSLFFMSSWLSGSSTCLAFWTLHSQVSWDAPSSKFGCPQKEQLLGFRSYLHADDSQISSQFSLSSDLDILTLHLTSSLVYLRGTSNVLDLEARWMMAPQRCLCPTLQNCEYVNLHGKRDFVSIAKLRNLSWISILIGPL